MLWYFGYRAKPDGRVLVSEAYEDHEIARMARDKIKAPDMEVTSRFLAQNFEAALKQAKIELE